jgi:lipopolysaccharide transport system permease protein
VIEPGSGGRGLGLGEVWAHRELLWVLLSRDVRVKYKQTALGVLWAVIRPALTLALFSVLFRRVGGVPTDGVPYEVFAYAGVVAWMFFSSSVASASQSLVSASALVTKTWFPRILIPFSSLGAATLDFAVSATLLAPLLAWHGVSPSARLLVAPAAMLWLAAVALGLGALLSSVVARWRDVGHALPFLLQLWMFATPVLFSTALFPEAWRLPLSLNPALGPVEAFRWSVAGGALAPERLAISGAAGAACVLLGLVVFRRLEVRLADTL